MGILTPPCQLIWPEACASLGKDRKKDVKLSPVLTSDDTNATSMLFKVMWLVYNMISYHLVFGKWLWMLVVGFQGQKWMCVKSWVPGSGQSNAPSHSVLIPVCSMAGYWKDQFFFDPQSNSMVGQTQDLAQPGVLTASSTSIQRKILVKIKKSIIRNNYEPV